MPKTIAKETQAKVAFGDVVRLSKERSKDPEADGFERYVGLEHLEPGDLKIRSWGYIVDGTTFTNVFHPGQVLFGKRRAYQRKVAVADFSGVCSGDIYVFEPKGKDLLPELLPFICQTEAFFDHAVGTSAGSLSPRTNWKSLAKFEFALPPLEEQRRIVEVLEAANFAQYRLTIAVRAGGNLFRSIIDSLMYGRLDTGHNRVYSDTKIGRIPRDWQLQPLSDLCTKITDGVHKRPNYIPEGIPFITVENLTRSRGIDFDTQRFISEQDHELFCKRTRPERGDVLISKDGATLGVPQVIDTDRPFSIFVSVALLKPQRDLLDGMYLRYFLKSSLFQRVLAGKVSGSAIPHIHLVDLRNTLIPLPSLKEQVAISRIARDIELTYWSLMEKERSSQYVLREAISHVIAEPQS